MHRNAVVVAAAFAAWLALAAGVPAQQAAPQADAPASAASQDAAARIAAALRLPEVFDIMAEEGRDYGRTLEEGMFPGGGGVGWAADVARIYDADRTYATFMDRFAAELADAGTRGAIEAFLAGDLAQKAVGLEVSARRAMLDDAIDEAARRKAEDLAAAGDPQYALVREFIEANDLIESNVAGGLNSARAFYQGLAAGGAFDGGISDDQILSDVWQQEPEIRAETEIWISAMLNVAYAPLSEQELRDYIAFSRSAAGRDLNRALFTAYDAAFLDVSHQLGLAAAKYIAGQTL